MRHSSRGDLIPVFSSALTALVFVGTLHALALPLQTTKDENAQAAIRRAESMRKAHDLSGAISVIESFAQTNDAGYDLWMELASLCAEHADPTQQPQQREALVHALALQPNARDANFQLGELLLKAGDYPEAMDRFETVLAVQPRDAPARVGERTAVMSLATAMRGQAKPEAALLALEHAVRALPDDPQLLEALGIEQTELGNTEAALVTLGLARTLAPENNGVLYALAHTQFDAQHLADAESSLRSYLSHVPNDASAHFALGRAYEISLEPEQARSEFERSIELQPTQTESFYELGDMALNAGDLTAAEPLLQRVLQRDPRHGGALTDIGRICLLRKEDARAEDWLSQAVAAAPKYSQAHYQHALALARLGRKSESEKEATLAAELSRRPNPAQPPLPQ